MDTRNLRGTPSKEGKAQDGAAKRQNSEAQRVPSGSRKSKRLFGTLKKLTRLLNSRHSSVYYSEFLFLTPKLVQVNISSLLQ